jgi:hypothetical protein
VYDELALKDSQLRNAGRALARRGFLLEMPREHRTQRAIYLRMAPPEFSAYARWGVEQATSDGIGDQ